MKKRIVSLLLILSMLLAAMPMAVLPILASDGVNAQKTRARNPLITIPCT